MNDIVGLWRAAVFIYARGYVLAQVCFLREFGA